MFPYFIGGGDHWLGVHLFGHTQKEFSSKEDSTCTKQVNCH